MKVWLLHVGNSPDPFVVGVFDDEHKERAEEAAELMGGYVGGEPLFVNDFSCEKPPPGEAFRVSMDQNGKSTWDGTWNYIAFPLPRLNSEGRCWESGYRVRQDESCWSLYATLYAQNREHAVKIVDEIRVQVLAGDKPKEGSI